MKNTVKVLAFSLTTIFAVSGFSLDVCVDLEKKATIKRSFSCELTHTDRADNLVSKTVIVHDTKESGYSSQPTNNYVRFVGSVVKLVVDHGLNVEVAPANSANLAALEKACLLQKEIQSSKSGTYAEVAFSKSIDDMYRDTVIEPLTNVLIPDEASVSDWLKIQTEKLLPSLGVYKKYVLNLSLIHI